MATVNLYSDIERLNSCDVIGTLADRNESSTIYDVPLLFLAIYHMIEWIRASILLTVTCIGVNIVSIWYWTILNSLYGLIGYSVAHMSYFSDEGQLCKDVQEHRSQWLLAEIIAFWVLFFIFSFPFLGTLCLGKDSADVTLLKNYVEANDDDEEAE